MIRATNEDWLFSSHQSRPEQCDDLLHQLLPNVNLLRGRSLPLCKLDLLHPGNFSPECSNSTLFEKKTENPFHMNQATVACSPSSAPSIDSPSSVHHSSSSSSSSPKRPSKTRSVSSSSMKISIIADIIVRAAPT